MTQPLAVIVEDQQHLAILYEDALRLVGYNVHSLHDGLEALNYLAIHDAPDFIILDVNLPSLSGHDIHKHIRGSDKYNQTPVIILTANSLMLEKIRPDIVENDYLIIKPIGMRQLQDLARAVLNRSDEPSAPQEDSPKDPDEQEEMPTKFDEGSK